MDGSSVFHPYWKLNPIAAPYLRNKASFRREEEPLVDDEDDDFQAVIPPMTAGRIRIPPALMPDEETAQQYFDLYFTNIHPFLPALSKTIFYQQWNTNRSAISPLILEGIFAIGGRVADEPVQGQQWLALAACESSPSMDTCKFQARLMPGSPRGRVHGYSEA